MEDTDEQLVERTGRGDRAAASQLVLRHTDRIYALCFRMLGEQAAAQDATQETFLRLWRSASKWRPKGAKFGTWLYRVAMNICIDRLRRTKRDAPEDAAPERADPGPLPDQALFLEERKTTVEAAVSDLPVRQRMAITLCYFQELSNIEAAEIMEVSVDALESLLSRGRRGLKESLAPMAASISGEMERGGMAHDHTIKL